MTLGKSALAYASKGWRVFPVYEPTGSGCACAEGCKKPGKHPRIKAWTTRATTDPDTITKWWERSPDANIGIATGRESGIVVLDVDVGPGKDGMASLAELEQDIGELPETLTVRTGSGGLHIYFVAPDQRLASQIGFRPGLDVLSEKRYVVAPPSMHPSGTQYAFEGNDITDLAPMPEGLQKALKIARKGTNDARIKEQPLRRSKRQQAETIPVGERNHTLTSMGGTMRSVGFGRRAIGAALHATNRELCDPPLDEEEVRGIIKSVTSRYAPGVPRAGGIFLPREMVGNTGLWHSADAFRLFEYLVSKATWPGERTDGLGPGEVRMSLSKMARGCAHEENNQPIEWSRSRVKDLLRYLEIDGRIEVLSTRPRTHIRVVNYEQYRGVPLGS